MVKKSKGVFLALTGVQAPRDADPTLHPHQWESDRDWDWVHAAVPPKYLRLLEREAVLYEAHRRVERGLFEDWCREWQSAPGAAGVAADTLTRLYAHPAIREALQGHQGRSQGQSSPGDGGVGELRALMDRGVPVEYILGWAPFCGHRYNAG